MVFKHYVHSTYGQLLEFHQHEQFRTENINVITIVASLLQLFYFQITEMFGLICTLVPLCQFAIMFLCFLVNSMCDVLQTRDTCKKFTKLSIFVLQTAVLLALFAFCVKYLFGVIIGLIGAAMANFVNIYKYFWMPNMKTSIGIIVASDENVKNASLVHVFINLMLFYFYFLVSFAEIYTAQRYIVLSPVRLDVKTKMFFWRTVLTHRWRRSISYIWLWTTRDWPSCFSNYDFPVNHLCEADSIEARGLRITATCGQQNYLSKR